MHRLAVLAVFGLAFVAQGACAQGYPTKSIRLVVPFGPGGSADAIARPLADKLSQGLGQSVVVDNRPGGLTVIAADMVAKSAPDGYTLYLMPGTHVLTPYMVEKVPFDPISDFSPVAYLGAQPYMFVANVQQPYRTFAEMAAYAKANPGGVTIGTSDAVTLTAASALKAVTKLDLTIVPYKGGGPQNTDLIGNQIAMAVGTPNMMQFIQQGKIRALAVTAPSRVTYLRDVPAVAEAVPGSAFDVQTWYAIAAPAKTPKPIVDRLHAEIRKLVLDGEFRRKLDDLGMPTPADTSPDAVLAVMKDYRDRMGKLIQAAGIKPE